MFEFQNLSENEKQYKETPEYENLAKKGLIYIDPEDGEWVSGLEKGGATLRYQVVPVERTRRTKAFDFLEKKDTYVQDNGMESEVYAISVYFIGPGHASIAEKFERALALPGIGLLQLPLDVLPEQRRVMMMRYKRTNQFVAGANRTLFDVQFRKTTPPPSAASWKRLSSAMDALAAAQQSLSDFNDEAINQAKTQDGIRGYVKGINDALSTGIDGINSVKNQIDSTLTALDTSINNVFSKPLVMAQQIQTLLTTPRFTSLTDTITSYKAVIDSVTDNPEQLLPGVSDILGVQALIGLSASTVLVSSVSSAAYTTRQEAVDAFQDALDTYGTFLDYLVEMEEYTAELPLSQRFRINPDLYQTAYEFITNTCGNVDRRLLGLKKEATFVTEQDTTAVNLAAKHYPEQFAEDAVAAIDLVERTNNLTKDAILLIEGGSEYKVLI